MDFPSGKYSVILADPPWQYQDSASNGSAENHYPTMSTQELEKLPVKSISDDDAILCVWATWPMLPDALRVISAWGFSYKTAGFVWIKRNQNDAGIFRGTGNYSRANSEPCLIGTRGSAAKMIIDHSIGQVIFTSREIHSRKPAEVRERIEKMCGPSTRRIELFARDRVHGWDAWGNEIPKSVQTRWSFLSSGWV